MWLICLHANSEPRGVDFPQQGQSPVLGVIEGDVGHRITFDPLQEVGHGLLFVTAGVVRAAQLHLLFSGRESGKSHD